jgi:hypothetical protein
MRTKTLACASTVLTLLTIAAGAQAAMRVHVLSNRADLVAGPEVLVSVSLPSKAKPEAAYVTLDGQDVTGEFALRPNGSYEGLVTGLQPGTHVLRAQYKGKSAQATITDHAIGGPVTAGPQVQPWRCENSDATDAQCDAPPTFSYEYKSALTGAMQSYEPESPPPAEEIADVTTEDGQTVPFIVRTETGYEDRDQYKIAVLFQPGMSWDAWAPQPQFNHKLLITHGASCGIEHESGTAPSVTSDTVGVPGVSANTTSPLTALEKGFVVMSTALDNAGHNCNIATEAESLIIAKQHLVDRYGTLRFTIGTGCSGGSLVQQQVANAYPGIYQGILPQCSFQDAWSNAQQIVDYHLTLAYFENPAEWGAGVAWTPAQIDAIEGHLNPGNAVIFNAVYWEELANPVKSCAGVESSEQYDPTSNPSGTRCDLADYMENVFGPRVESSWGPVEQQLGHGFAGRPIGNVGVQYGLKALQEGVISPAQFVDINTNVGGVDIDDQPTKSRTPADQPALQNSYRSGAVNEANNLASVAIIDLRGPDPGAFHDAYRSWSMRARLERDEGRFPKNDVIWFGQAPLIGSPTYTTEGLEAMNRWLDAVEADPRALSLEAKIAEDRPEDVHDRCSSVEAAEELVREVEVPGVGEVCEAPLVETKFATPRVQAGESITTDDQECQLKPLRRSDYYPVTFSEEQWSALQQTFPNGVCDFSKTGIGQQPTIPWLTYQNDAEGGAVAYGGKPLGRAPAGSGEGWTSEAFDGWLDPGVKKKK